MFNIDIAIVVIFLLVTLGVGLYHGQGTTTMQIFALGGRNFSTATLASTLSATQISGSSFVIGITYAYQDGLLKTFATIGIIIYILIMGYIFAPRTKEFLGSVNKVIAL